MSSSSGNTGGFLMVILCVVVFIAIIIVGTSCFVIVPAGHVGVQDTFGSVAPDVLQPGLHLKNPFTGVIMFSTQTQKYYDPGTTGDSDVATIAALSNEGLTIQMGIAVLYHIDPSYAPSIYKNIGVEYQSILMKQPIHAFPRDLISRYDFKTLYSAGASADNPDRARIEQELTKGISAALQDTGGQNRGIIIENVYIRAVDPPQSLKDSITAKLTMEQQIQQKAFEVQVAQKEAERKIAEAQGIAKANQIIANSITPGYIDWYTIEMMKEHTGATYFIPIGTDGRFHPELVTAVNSVSMGNSTG